MHFDEKLIMNVFKIAENSVKSHKRRIIFLRRENLNIYRRAIFSCVRQLFRLITLLKIESPGAGLTPCPLYVSSKLSIYHAFMAAQKKTIASKIQPPMINSFSRDYQSSFISNYCP